MNRARRNTPPVLKLLAAAVQENDSSTLGGSGPLKNEITPELRQRVGKGLKWLKDHLGDNGTMGPGAGQQAGIMALAGIAFLADGSTPGEGPYGEQVQKILDYVLRNCQATGLITSPNDGSPMYGHGFATLFLAECYGMTGREDIKEKLQMAVRLIVRTQNKE